PGHLVPDLPVLGVDAADRRVDEAVAVGDGEPANRFQARELDHRGFRVYRLEVLLLEPYGATGPFPPRLLARLPGPRHDRALAEGVDAPHEPAAAAAAVRHHPGHRHDAPPECEHR